jgi:hypothetical protein
MKRMQMVRVEGFRANPSIDQLARIYRHRALMSNMPGYDKREVAIQNDES